MEPFPVDHEKSKIKRPETLLALDLDRTLLNTTRFVDLVLDYLSHSSGNLSSKIDEIRREEKANRGKSYDYMGALSRAGVELDSDGFVDSICENDLPSLAALAHELIAPGAVELLKAVRENPNVSAMVLTTGSEKAQSMKIKLFNRLADLAAICDGGRGEIAPPAVIISEEGKANLLAGALHGERGFWPDDMKTPLTKLGFDGIDRRETDSSDGEYYRVDEIWDAIRNLIIVDDKAVNLKSDNPRIRGVQVPPLGSEDREQVRLDDLVLGMLK